MTGSHEVRGSTPLCSTTKTAGHRMNSVACFFVFWWSFDPRGQSGDNGGNVPGREPWPCRPWFRDFFGGCSAGRLAVFLAEPLRGPRAVRAVFGDRPGSGGLAVPSGFRRAFGSARRLARPSSSPFCRLPPSYLHAARWGVRRRAPLPNQRQPGRSRAGRGRTYRA